MSGRSARCWRHTGGARPTCSTATRSTGTLCAPLGTLRSSGVLNCGAAARRNLMPEPWPGPAESWEPPPVEVCDAKDGPRNNCYMDWNLVFVSFKDKMCAACFGDFEPGEHERLYEDDMRLDAAAACRFCLV